MRRSSPILLTPGRSSPSPSRISAMSAPTKTTSRPSIWRRRPARAASFYTAPSRRRHIDGLDVVFVGADIADMREGEGDDLPGVRRIGEDLLIAGHGGIEADLADRVAYGAQALALQHGSVGQHQKRRRLGLIPSAGGGGFRLGHGLLVAYYVWEGKNRCGHFSGRKPCCATTSIKL